MKNTILITGASSGIGKEIAYVYAKQGYNIIICARRKELLNNIKKDIESLYSVSVNIFTVNLSTLESADELYKQIKEKSLTVDVLVNNAGFGINGYFINTDFNQESNMMMLNMMSLVRLTKLFALDMVKKGSGNIINIASTAAFQPVPGFAVYAATKSFVLSFSEAIAYELKNKNVIVTTICPGATESEFSKVANVKNPNIFNKAPSALQVAEFTYKMMKRKKSVAIHGLKNRVLVLFTRFSPRKVITAIAAKMMN